MTNKNFTDTSFLVDAVALAAKIGEVSLIDVRPAEDFAAGHIEGARHLDIYGVSLNNTASEPLEAFVSIFDTLFGSRGVIGGRPVVIYDHESGERSARATWLLAVLDHPDVRMLDGGSQAWTRAGMPFVRIEQGAEVIDPKKAPPTPPPFRGGRRYEYLATRFDVADAIDDENTIIIDVRRESEYLGTEKRARRVGTIPNAVHVFWREHLDQLGELRPAEDIRALYEAKGVTPDKSIIAFCQGGYRSASTFFALRALGYPNVRNYIGSWGEWGNRDDSRITLPR